jgi:hypothetical protein
MTKEEFEAEFIRALTTYYFPAWGHLPYDEIESLARIARKAAEPLFEEIEKLREPEEDKIGIIKRLEDLLFKAESERTYWFDRYSLEMAKNLKLTERINILERRPEDDQSKEE